MPFTEIPDFVQRLIEAGWTEEEAKDEWRRIQSDEEAGED